MKKIKLLLLTIFLPVLLKAQYMDCGIRVSKFNQGIVSKMIIGGFGSRSNNPYGFEGFLGYSAIAGGGYSGSVSFLKEWNIMAPSGRYSEFYFITQLGAQFGFYKDLYYVDSKGKPNFYNPNGNTFNVGLINFIGIDWISKHNPISITLTCNPWFDLINPGPEWIDFNFSLKYQISY